MNMLSLEIALKTLMRNKERFLYPVIGTMVGIAAVVAIFSLAVGGKKLVEEDLASLSDNRVMIGGNFSKRDIDSIEGLPFVSYTHLTDAIYDRNGIRVVGYTDKALRVKGLKAPRNGEILLEEGEAEKKSARIGSFTSIEMGNEKLNFKVTGTFKESVLAKKTYGIVSQAYFDRLFGVYGNNNGAKLLIAFYPEEDAVQSSEHILAMLRRQNPGRRYELLEDNENYQKAKNIKRTISVLLIAISVTSLGAAGITISNMLISSVRERTEEIGILMAMGTGRKTIREIFLVESTAVSVLGGAAGIVLGIIISKVLGRLIGIPPQTEFLYVAITFITACAVGIAAGVKPADIAAKMNVIDALKK